MTARAQRMSCMPSPVIIHAGSRVSLGSSMETSNSGAPASGAWPAANDMLAFPFTLTAPMTKIYKAFVETGSSGGGGNWGVGVYDADFNLLIETASTAGSGNSAPQAAVFESSVVLKLPSGLFYAAMVADNTTANRYTRWNVATTGQGFWKCAGCWKQASVTAGSMPNPATPVAITGTAFPLFGLITRTFFDM